MARQIYFRGQASPASVSIPQAHGAATVPHVRSEGAEILKGLADLGKAATHAYIRWDDKRQQSLIEDAYLKARGEMSKWSAEYQRNNQGADALEAQAAFEQQWDRISQGIQNAYQGKLSDGAMHFLGRKMELGRLYALDDGAKWQAQQTAAWNKNQEQVRLSQMGEDVANDPYNFSRHQMNVNEAVSAWERANPGMDSSAYRRKLEQGVFEGIFNGMVAREDYDGAEKVLNWGSRGAVGQGQVQDQAATGGTPGAGLHGAVTHTGVARVLAYRESGKEGSQHVSYGLPQTDGVDVGKYSMITKGGRGGSVGEFIRWAGTQGGVGKELHDKMQALVGGNWGALDSRKLWKEEAESIWKETAKSNPKAFEELEDRFMQRRFDSVISKLRPEVQEAIRNDKSGALYEMAISTINQHVTAKDILNRNFDADPEVYIRRVYQDRGDPARFARTSDPSMGRRRMNAEVKDVLGILQGQAVAQAGTQAGSEQNTVNQSGVPGSYGESSGSPQGVGGGAPSSIFDPGKIQSMRKQIKAGRELQAKEAVLGTAQQLLAETSSMSPEDQKVAIYGKMAGLEPSLQAEVKKHIDNGIKFREDLLDAQYGSIMAKFMANADKLSPVDREVAIDNLEKTKQLSPEKAAKLRTWDKSAIERVTPEREETFNKLLDEGNRNIAMGVEGAMTDISDIDREFARGKLTPKQRADLIKIRRDGGALKNFGKTHLDDLYSKVTGKKNAKMPAEMYTRLFNWGLESGKPLDDDAIKTQIARDLTPVSVPGRLWGTREKPLWEAESDKNKIIGIPIPPERDALITDEMKRAGFTDEQIQNQTTREQFYANKFYGRK